jgi:hypothetical protein
MVSARDAQRLAAHHVSKPDPGAIAASPWITTDPRRGSELRQRLGHYLGAHAQFRRRRWYSRTSIGRIYSRVSFARRRPRRRRARGPHCAPTTPNLGCATPARGCPAGAA